MTRPDCEAALARLKPFQRRTVEHAYGQLFEASNSTGRFLVADEVGLGKTLVARGVIARAVDQLWGKVKRIDIVYICSNSSIARANIEKLTLGHNTGPDKPISTRLTMLATDLHALNREPAPGGSTLNFVTFTPSTSFEMGHSMGRDTEREVLYHLLRPLLAGRETPLANILQGNIQSPERWQERLRSVKPIEDSIRERFRLAFDAHPTLRRDFFSLDERWFFRRQPSWPEEARAARGVFIATLRRVLAKASIEALEPDLVILDEFQRFRNLLETREEARDEAAELAHALFSARTPEGQPVRTLLLSATPYKLFTATAEVGHDDHYDDFMATTRFLFGGEEARVVDLKRRLDVFRGALKRAAAGAETNIGEHKRGVEALLTTVVARTERVAASADQNSMVAEKRSVQAVAAPDVSEYLGTHALFDAVDAGDPMPFWKSAPYATHFMRDYAFNRRLEAAIEERPQEISAVLKAHSGAFLAARDLEQWRALDPKNGRLRAVAADLLENGLWRLLWMPPTVPYWPLSGPFHGHERATKTLLFSAWNVVPDVLSGVLSYEAERLMVGGELRAYRKLAKQQSPLLRFARSPKGEPTGHRMLLLRLPCLRLADEAHPLSAPPGADRKEWVRARVQQLLADSELPDPVGVQPDERWYWAAPLLLDPGLREFLTEGGLAADGPDERAEKPVDGVPAEDADSHADAATEGAMGKCLEALLRLGPDTLGRRPDDLVDVLSEVALGSPAVLAARAIAGAVGDRARRSAAAQIARAFWSLFNRPAVIALLRTTYSDAGKADESEGRYWRLVLRYCVEGNLQAVLDETWHIAWEEGRWDLGTTEDETAAACALKIAQTAKPTRSRVHATFLRADRLESAPPDTLQLRTDFAVRFGGTSSEETQQSADAVRRAFNSPFRPFVLTSTSVGQEGLDFHPWCHRIVHWNLPGNPVDFEQREGRVNRFKCHAVRRNVAEQFGEAALQEWRVGKDLWEVLFALADKDARGRNESDLIPYWIAPGSHRVERHVPLLSHSREVAAFERLRRQLAAYRVVFGQPRQEELLALLQRADLPLETLRGWAIDLSPPKAGPPPRP